MLQRYLWGCGLLAASSIYLAGTPFDVPTLMQLRNFRDFAGTPHLGLSPGSDKLFVVRHYSELGSDLHRDELDVFSLQELRRAIDSKTTPQPFRSVSFRTGSNWAAISSVRWIEDGAALIFLGSNDPRLRYVSPYALYRLSVESGELSKLGDDVPDGMIGAEGSSVAFMLKAGEALSTRTDSLLRYPAAFVDPPSLIYAAQGVYDVRAPLWNLCVSLKGHPVKTLLERVQLGGDGKHLGYWLSPDGLRLLLRVPAALRWQLEAKFNLAPLPSAGGFSFVLVDVNTWQARALSGDALIRKVQGYDAPRVLWSSSGDRIIVASTAFPLGVSSPAVSLVLAEFEAASGVGRVLEATPIDQTSETLERHQGMSLKWIKQDTSFLAERTRGILGSVKTQGAIESKSLFERKENTWLARPADDVRSLPPGLADRLPNVISVTIEESENDPPRVVFRDGQRTLDVYGPDPALEGVEIARSRLVHWTDEKGNAYTSNVVVPKSPQGPLPLVVQLMYGGPVAIENHRFLPGGVPAVTYSAQALAAKGFAVLQLDANQLPFWFEAEGPGAVLAVESAVLELSRQGIVDPRRVGLVGQSRMAYRVNYILTHASKVDFAAAVSDDGLPLGYPGFLTHESMGEPPSEYSTKYGGLFWDKKAVWLESAPGFRAEHITAPLLLMSSFRGDPLWTDNLPRIGDELFYALTILQRPVEFIVFPRGFHGRLHSRQQFASHQATVDWLSFWLLNSERVEPCIDAGETKETLFDQYERWRRLKVLARPSG